MAAYSKNAQDALARTVAGIELELKRLTVDCADDCPNGLCVVAKANLPAGWVRVYDDHANAYGPAKQILGILANLQLENDEDVFDAVWAALTDFDDAPPQNSHDWPAELQNATAYNPDAPSTPNDDPIMIVQLETNAGTRWTWGPSGSDCDPIYDTLSQGGKLHDTEAEALAELVACETENLDQDDE